MAPHLQRGSFWKAGDRVFFFNIYIKFYSFCSAPFNVFNLFLAGLSSSLSSMAGQSEGSPIVKKQNETGSASAPPPATPRAPRTPTAAIALSPNKQNKKQTETAPKQNKMEKKKKKRFSQMRKFTFIRFIEPAEREEIGIGHYREGGVGGWRGGQAGLQHPCAGRRPVRAGRARVRCLVLSAWLEADSAP